MTDITIPPAALEAGARQLKKLFFLNDTDAEFSARAAFNAIVEAWPGMRMMVDIDTGDDAAIKLPLAQENSDE